MKYIICPILLILISFKLGAQELYPLTESASSVPKKALGLRLFNHSYSETNNQLRNLFGLRIMYGLTPRLSVYIMPTVSNHHSKDLPPDFPDHNTPQVGVYLPYRFNGVHFYAKYRFLSRDGDHSHLRAAVYGEWGQMDVAHDEGEPTLMDDTKGGAGGFIITSLKHRFAATLTAGVIIPSAYRGEVPDFIPGLPGVPAEVHYGRAVNYSLALGYLLLPKKYKNYNQSNLNIYLELIGKSYEAARIYFDNIGQPGTPYPVSGSGSDALAAGNYIEAHPGVQLIIKSNTRIDLSIGFPVVEKSFTRFYPVYEIGFQRYFYFK